MACDTFLKIAQRCKHKFVVPQVGDAGTFIEALCERLGTIITDLEPHQVHTFYEAAGCMISSHHEPASRERLVEMLMALPNISWQRCVPLTL
jgi:exportin-1